MKKSDTLTLVLGASLKKDRASNLVIERLVQKGYPVVAVGQKSGLVAGQKIETELINFKGITTVSLYISPKHQPSYYDYIISLNPRRVIFNPGTENSKFIKMLEQQDIHAEVACSLVLLSIDRF